MSYTFLHKISQIFSLQYIRVLFLLLSLTSVGVILYPGFVRAELAPASQSNETHINPSITKIALFSSGDAESLSITPFGPNPVSLNSEVREITNQQAEDCVIYPIMIPNSKVSGQNFGNVITIPVTTIHDVPGHFGFVQWDSTALQSDQILEDDMQNPGNVTTNYVEPGSNPPDTKLDAANVNWIRANPGTHSAVVDELNGLINTVMPLPVWNDADCLVSGPGTCSNALGSGPTAKYRAFTFVQLLLTDVRFNGNSCGTPGQKCLVFRFLGFDTGAVDQCTPPDDSHSVSNLDIAMVLDTTGSMQFDTICYGCWERCDDVPPGELGTAPCLIANDVYQDYPLNGFAYPLDFDGLKETYICGNGGDCTTSPYITPGDPKPSGSNDYIILEAELYSNLVDSIWDPAFRGADVGYWALQRDGTRYSVPSEGGRSAYVRHHPFLAFNAGKPFGHAYTLADIQSGEMPIPRLEYDFIPTWGGNTYIYVRADAFSSGTNPDPDDRIFWAVTPFGSPAPTTPTEFTNNSTNWNWFQLGSQSLTANNKYTLHLYAGSPGYSIDRIIIAGTSSYDTVGEITAAIHDDNATPGTAQRVAADRCNPIYGLSVIASECRPDGIVLPSSSVNNLDDPLFGDRQPMRGTKEAVKLFVEQLNPSLDQVGLVQFNNTAYQESQLECLQSSAARKAAHAPLTNYPLNASVLGEFDETECYNPALAAGGTPIGYRNVLMAIENTYANGSTDIASGLRRGLNLLGIDTDSSDGGPHQNDCNWNYTGGNWQIGGINHEPLTGRDPATKDIDSHCSRGTNANPVIVLVTDGVPSDSTPGDTTDCNVAPDPLPYPDYPGGNKYNCVMYYAEVAANNGVPICTVGMGPGVDSDLLRAVAERTNGQYYFAPSAAQLNIIFNQVQNGVCIGTGNVNLAVTKTQAVSGWIEAGYPLTYTLAFTNFGPTSPVTATIVDTWTPPEAVTGVDAPGCDVDLGSGVFTCTRTNLSVGMPLVEQFLFTTSQTFAGTFTNTAEITPANGIEEHYPVNNHTSPVTVTVGSLSITKQGPAIAVVGDPITYTLTVINHRPESVSNIVIIDTLPADALYVSGGTRIGDVVSWTVPGLAANGGITQTTFVVKAAQTITNSDYRASSDGGHHATGSEAVTTEVTPLVCTQLLQNTSFEESGGWIFGDNQNLSQLSDFYYPDPAANWSTLMPASFWTAQHRAPHLSQNFVMPAGLTDQSAIRLKLYKAVHKLINPDFGGVDSPDDHLYFVLRSQGGVTLTNEILVAAGAENPADERTYIDPANPDGVDDWVLVSKEIVPEFVGNPADVAGETVEVYFYAPNPGAQNPGDPDRYTTNFYVDKIALELCNPVYELELTKIGPAMAIAGDLITYTLTVTNSGTTTATNVVITDAIPAGAHYIGGGIKNGDVVSWTLSSLSIPDGVTQTTYIVTATQTITNSNYRVRADGGYSATGSVSVVTTVSNSISDTGDIYLPIILK